MSTMADAAEKRKLRSIARRYERDGYRVTVPEGGGDFPAFLQGFTPDLIAESERDRVVIELKRSNTVPGSNELREIAERVSGQLALQHGLRAAKMPFGQAVRELVFRGIVPHEALDTVEQARAVRNCLMHAEQEIVPSAADVEGLLALSRRLHGEMSAVATGRSLQPV